MEDRRSFFTELRRRNVYKVGAMYAVAGWLLVQVITQVLPIFDVPALGQRIMVLAIIAGFPLALMLSWIYELTPDGIVKTDEIAPGASIKRHTGRRLNVAIISALTIAVLVLLTKVFWPQVTGFSKSTSSAIVSDQSIAVLPFENLSHNPDNAYFAEGMQDEILTRLAQIGALKVISRTSTQQYASKPSSLVEIGKQLGVANILEGSIQRSGDAVHINVQLIKADGDSHIWAEVYDRKLTDVFGVEGEVATAIASALNAKLSGAERQALARKPTQNAEAYNDYLQGLFYFGRFSVEGFHRSIDFLTQATRLDPEYGAAFIELSTAWSSLADRLGGQEAVDANEKARAAAKRALVLEPNLGDAHAALGWILMNSDWDLPAAIAEFRRANELPPVTSRSKNSLAVAMADTGHLDEAVALARQAIEIDPLSSHAEYDVASYQIALGEFDAADQSLRRAIDLQPQGTGNYALLAVNELARHHPADALKDAEQETDELWQAYALALALYANGNRALADTKLKWLIQTHAEDAPDQIADIYAYRGETDEAFSWLDKAYSARDPGLLALRFDSLFIPYRDDQRYEAMARKLGVLES